MSIKRYFIIIFVCCIIILSIGRFYIQQNHINSQNSITVIQSLQSWWNICEAMKSIYQQSFSVDSQVEYCRTKGREEYFKIQRLWWEGWSWVDYYNLRGNKIWSISQYWYGDWTIPEKPAISWKTYSNNDSCIKKNIQECGIIDLVSSYRWPEWLLKESEYAKTCENTLDKLWLNPRHQRTDWDSSRRDLSHRYFMCTDDSDIFYIGFTGSKIWDNKSANYQNFNTIGYFNFKGKSLWLITGFQLKTNGDQLHWISIYDKKAPYAIKRCIDIPTYDCYEWQ